MPPPIKRDDCVIVFDLNVADEFFVKAKECLLDIYCSKWCSESRDCICLLPFGNKQTADNFFYDYNPKQVLRAIRGVEENDGKILQALLRALKLLEKRHSDSVTGKGLFTRQLLCISDFSKCTLAGNDALVEQITLRLNKIKAFLYVLGPEVSLNGKTLLNGSDVREWVKNPRFTVCGNENFQVVKRLVQAVDRSLVCDVTLGVSMFNYYKCWAGPQPCLIPITVGENKLQFTNRSLRCLKSASFMSLQSNFWTNQNSAYVLAALPEVEVDRENVVRAVQTCEKFVAIPQSLRDSFKTKEERTFDLLGFAARSELPAVYFVGDGTHKITPADIHGEWTLGLIRVLKQKQLVGIAAKRVIRNTRIKFWALIPADHSDRWLYAVQLPYGNHMRQSYAVTEPDPTSDLDSLVAKAPPNQSEIYQYLDNMQLTDSDMPLNVTMTHNPQYKRWWRFVLHKHFGVNTNWGEEILGKRQRVSHEPLISFWKTRDVVNTEAADTSHADIDDYDDEFNY